MAVILLRLVHSLFAAYFIACIGYIYYAVITQEVNWFLIVAVFSLVVEGVLVFVLNGGHCPLAPLQRKLNDPTPFFNLFLPEPLAKLAIPFFTIITVIGIALVVIRLVLKMG